MASNISKSDTKSSPTNSGQAKNNQDDRARQPSVPANANVRSSRRRVTLSHTKLVFSDPVAFRYLEEDDATIVLDRWKRLQGYELYVVEQWVCSRTHPTFIICTYTGDASHSVLVNVLAIPNDKAKWSRRLQIYFDAVSQFHAREQETSLGTLMVTNLSSFPSALAVILVPDGDVKKHRDIFIINEDLKRMGCAGRAGMNLSEPPQSTVAKFQHLYQTSETIDFRSSVVELVKTCQIALVLYGKLDPIYCDGLLCDVTERAVSDWWNDIGTDFHNIEPSDGILGPTTVSALLGLLIGAFNRLKAAGIATGKDVLDVDSMKRSISAFQKVTKIKKTRRLDRETLDRLHRATAKMASGDGWAVPRAVKSTVAELSGKGGEMIMGVVGARDKAGIAEVETLDIDRLAQLVTGARLRWLWQGKRMKSTAGDVFGQQSGDHHDWVFSTDNAGNYLWTSGNRESLDEAGNMNAANSQNPNESKFGRFRDAVGIPTSKPYNLKSQKQDEDPVEQENAPAETVTARSSKENKRVHDQLSRHSTSQESRQAQEELLKKKPALNLALANDAKSTPPVLHPHNRLQPVISTTESFKSSHREQLRAIARSAGDSPGRRRVKAELTSIRDDIQADVYQNFATEFDDQGPEDTVLRRSKSALQVREFEAGQMQLASIPRRLSFSLVEGLVARIDPGQEYDSQQKLSGTDTVSLSSQMNVCEAEAVKLKELAAKLVRLEQKLLPYAENEMLQVEALDAESREHLFELNNIYYSRFEEYQALQATSTDLVAREKASLNDGIRRVEMLGAKLDYELGALQSRMQEVEDAAAEFERNVLEIEARVVQLVDERHGQARDPRNIPWLQRFINFMGSRKYFSF